MAPRKDGPSPAQLRLARLAGTARPTSEQTPPPPSEPPSPDHQLQPAPESIARVEPVARPHTDAAGHTEVAVTPPVADHDTPHDAGVVTPHDAGVVASHDAGAVTPHDAGFVTPHDAGVVTPHDAGVVTPVVTAVVTAVVTPTGAEQLTARVRGRWTPDQRTFIDRFSKEQGATAAEVLRHIVAWYLQQEPSAAPVIKDVAPSGQTLVKRETGLRVLDFMTTPGQAAAIKRVAAQFEEAAWLRRAVDAYRVCGPLIKIAD